MILLNRLPEGKRNMITLSYDDGSVHDRRLVEIMDRYGIRGTFHLNSGRMAGAEGAWDKIISKEEIPTLYKNHEVSCHGVYHQHLRYLRPHQMVEEILEDRRSLEQACGYPVRGMSYAYAWYSDEVISAMKACGMVYARTAEENKGWTLPEDFMKWHPRCHHRRCLEEAENFMKLADNPNAAMYILYVWGHSVEFNQANNWDKIEKFCQMVGGRDDIWYATNIEIYDYITAQRSLVISADNTMIYNPSALRVWFTADGEVMSVAPGELLKLD